MICDSDVQEFPWKLPWLSLVLCDGTSNGRLSQAGRSGEGGGRLTERQRYPLEGQYFAFWVLHLGFHQRQWTSSLGVPLLVSPS
jgi:hypothetical protein